MVDWPQPRSAWAVQGFLGLAGYYRKFVREFGTIAAPLIALLRKEGFSWTPEAAVAFTALKTAMTTAPVLALPDFNHAFVVECDASSYGFGAVLLQDQHPLAFFSSQPRHAMCPWRRTNVNSLASSSPSAIGGHTCGDAVSW